MSFGFRVYPCCGRGADRADKTKMPWEEGKTTFWVLCGLPGTGKSTFATYLRESYPTGLCKIITRDVARMDLLWDSRKDPDKWKETHTSSMDDLTSELVLHRIKDAYSERRYHGIVVDGCHTRWDTLKQLLDMISEYENATINLVIIGTAKSRCMHRLSSRKKDDYGDYQDGSAFHNSLPQEVFEQKQREMLDLVTGDRFDQMGLLCDNIYLVPAYQGKPFTQ